MFTNTNYFYNSVCKQIISFVESLKIFIFLEIVEIRKKKRIKQNDEDEIFLCKSFPLYTN